MNFSQLRGFLLACILTGSATAADRGPNIIHILADDLGYGDVGYQGQKKFRTPNIDQLAAAGLVFTQHYSGNTVCAPSRSALLTGQHTGHTFVRGNKEVKPEGQHPLPAGTFTLTGMLRKHGYLYREFHERGGRLAIRKGNWKALRYDVLKKNGGKIQLYDLSKDIGETNDVAADHPEVVKEMAALFESARTPSEIFTFRSRQYQGQ